MNAAPTVITPAIIFDMKNSPNGWKPHRMRKKAGWSAKTIDEQTFMDIWLNQDTIPGITYARAFHIKEFISKACGALIKGISPVKWPNC